MLGPDQKGVAVVTIAIIVAVSAGGAVATPVVVDTIDVDPDHPLYGLERVGEGIKAAFIGGVDWERGRAQERITEYERMAERGRGEEFIGLVDKAEEHVNRVIAAAGTKEGLAVALEATQFHLIVLNRVKDKVPEAAKASIEQAITESSSVIEVLENTKNQVENLSDEEVRRILEENRDALRIPRTPRGP
jgi:hypothetical protein